jgi:hypothetical protein
LYHRTHLGFFEETFLECGRYSVKRHISNIHDGFSAPVPFIEYVVGRQTGMYGPPSQPMQTGHSGVQTQELRKIPYVLDTMFEEFWKENARQAARRSP